MGCGASKHALREGSPASTLQQQQQQPAHPSAPITSNVVAPNTLASPGVTDVAETGLPACENEHATAKSATDVEAKPPATTMVVVTSTHVQDLVLPVPVRADVEDAVKTSDNPPTLIEPATTKADSEHGATSAAVEQPVSRSARAGRKTMTTLSVGRSMAIDDGDSIVPVKLLDQPPRADTEQPVGLAPLSSARLTKRGTADARLMVMSLDKINAIRAQAGSPPGSPPSGGAFSHQPNSPNERVASPLSARASGQLAALFDIDMIDQRGVQAGHGSINSHVHRSNLSLEFGLRPHRQSNRARESTGQLHLSIGLSPTQVRHAVLSPAAADSLSAPNAAAAQDSDDSGHSLRKSASMMRYKTHEARRALLLDENPINLQLTSVTMHKAGFVVDTVSTASEALAQLAVRDYTVVLVEPQIPSLDSAQFLSAAKQSAHKHLGPSVSGHSIVHARTESRASQNGASDGIGTVHHNTVSTVSTSGWRSSNPAARSPGSTYRSPLYAAVSARVVFIALSSAHQASDLTDYAQAGYDACIAKGALVPSAVELVLQDVASVSDVVTRPSSSSLQEPSSRALTSQSNFAFVNEHNVLIHEVPSGVPAPDQTAVNVRPALRVITEIKAAVELGVSGDTDACSPAAGDMTPLTPVPELPMHDSVLIITSPKHALMNGGNMVSV